MAQSLLLISSRPDDLLFATTVAQLVGFELIQVEEAAAGAKIINDQGAPIIMVDASTEPQYREFEDAIASTVGILSTKMNANAVHFLTSSTIEHSKYLIESQIFGHYVLRNYQGPREAGEHYARIIRATCGDEQAFGLRKLLKPGVKVQTVQLQSTSQKQDAVEAVRNFLIAAKFQNRMATMVANAVDETLMNAMFDAPVDELGKSMFSSTARSTVIPLEGRSAVEMQVGYDGQYVAVTVTDLYGSLDKAKLLSHISKVYTEEEYKVRTSVAGAGIGLATVFRSGGSFLFVSDARTRTEVTVFFRKADNFRKFKDQFRFLSTQFYF